MDASLRAVIADDSVLLRDGLVRLLGDAGIVVVAAVGDGETLVKAVEEHQPDLAVMHPVRCQTVPANAVDRARRDRE